MSSSPVLSTPPNRSKLRAGETVRGPGRQIVWLTLGAIALFCAIRRLPTGTNLSHIDFQVTSGTSIEFCDPTNPQFIPVVSVRSPVTMVLALTGPSAVSGQSVSAMTTLTTSTGKPIGPEDLLVTHTQKLHLLIFDPALHDYQHVHPVPGAKRGQWLFSFTPHASGTYRIFADFTPIATARGLYANVDLEVGPRSGEKIEPAAPQGNIGQTRMVQDGIAFTLTAKETPVKVRTIENFHFSAARVDGRPAQLEPVMDAYAHLVAVDRERSGFAHLHPNQLVAVGSASAASSDLDFKVSIPHAGLYVIWAQVRVESRDRYIPFWFNVVEN